jgi:hypothetical protein
MGMGIKKHSRNQKGSCAGRSAEVVSIYGPPPEGGKCLIPSEPLAKFFFEVENRSDAQKVPGSTGFPACANLALTRYVWIIRNLARGSSTAQKVIFGSRRPLQKTSTCACASETPISLF